MKIYRVGGSVRDQMMGLEPHDHDYVVVGATPAEMETLGYKQVGKDFPVFLHPKTNEEYALARKERKTGFGHTDFETVFDTSVTIEEDLLRRDLTINAIAVPHNFEGDIVDPFNGMEDIKNKVLRHVSEAFKEDPLRILRICRFTAKFPDFKIAESTHSMIKKMVVDGELEHISADRIWAETKKALLSDHPENYFRNMKEINAEVYLTRHLEHYFYDEKYMKYVAKKTQDFSEDRKLLIRAATYYSYYHGWKDMDDKKYRKLLNDARIPTDVIDLSMFVGKHNDDLCLRFHHMTSINDMIKMLDSFNLKVMVQKNPNFIDDMYMVIDSYHHDEKEYEKMKRVMHAYLDTKEFLSCAVKRHRWSTGNEPSKEDYQQLLDQIRYDNVVAAANYYFGGIGFDQHKLLHMKWGPGHEQSN